MNKTVNINLAGFSFTIEESAYEALKAYIEAIKSFLSTEEDVEEILSDIENRIAELLQERLKEGREVVDQNDVEHIMSVLGDPQQFKTDSDDTEEEPTRKQRRRARKLYRNPDDKQIGGVCGGLASYFNIDPLVFRLAFVLGVIGFGVGIVPYLILWAIIPEAQTAAEKLEMEGEEVTVDNLKKRFRKESENIKKSFSNFKDGVKGHSPAANQVGQVLREILAFIGTILRMIWKVLGKIFGVAFVIAASFLLIGCVFLLFASFFAFDVAIFGELGKLPSTELADIFFRDSSDYNFMLFTSILFLSTVIIGLFIAGFGALGFKLPGKTALAVGLPTIIIICFFAFITLLLANASNFNEKATVQDFIVLEPFDSDTLSIHANEDIYFSPDVRGHHNESIKLLTLENEKLISGVVMVDVEQSQDSLWAVKISKESQGRTTKEARIKAQGINYSFNQEKNHIFFDPTFNWDKMLKYRDQQVRVTVMVPVGKTIYLNDGCDRIIYDIENVQNMYDGNMIKKYWLMEDRGLSLSN